jgi:hypothetical protein
MRRHAADYPRHMSKEDRRKRLYAREQVFVAVIQGRLVKTGCTADGEHKGAIHGHHHNGYENALDVVWLCASHHSKLHAAMRREQKEKAA